MITIIYFQWVKVTSRYLSGGWVWFCKVNCNNNGQFEYADPRDMDSHGFLFTNNINMLYEI